MAIRYGSASPLQQQVLVFCILLNRRVASPLYPVFTIFLSMKSMTVVPISAATVNSFFGGCLGILDCTVMAADMALSNSRLATSRVG
jgi:hypothetical protein